MGALSFFLTWWGLVLLGALDSSMLFFVPFGLDAVLIYLTARSQSFFWLYPLLATAGSLGGAVLTFWIGRKAGESGLEKLIAPSRLERIKRRVREKGAVAMALPALMPPPFPLTPFILACGALAVSPVRFFTTFGIVRLLRFGAEATLARIYGSGILGMLQSETFQQVIVAFVVVAIGGTVVSAVLLWRQTRHQQLRAA